MKTINAYQLQKLHFPVDDYLYIVQTWRSVDNGSSFAYCGESKYFRTEAEAAAYKAEQGQQENTAAYIVTNRETGEPLRGFETIEPALQAVIDLENADKENGVYLEQRYFIEYPEQDISINVFVGEENKGYICPKCGKTYTEPPAISRTDNKTEICPNCGVLEAVAAAGVDIYSEFSDALYREKVLEAVAAGNNYKICFINGHSLKYTEYETAAADLETAKQLFNDRYGAAFDHQIIFIYENGVCIYDRPAQK